MKTIKKIVSSALGISVLFINALPVFAKSSTDQTLINASIDAGLESVENTANIISDSIDSITIEKTEPEPVYEAQPEYIPVYSYSEPYVEVKEESTTVTVDEFMGLYGQTQETVMNAVPVDTTAEEQSYQLALANYNTALAEYEAANQMIETTKEIEVEIIEEVTDEEGNVSEISRTEIQTVTEMLPSGDVCSAQANLDITSAALNSASQALEAAQSQTAIVEQPKTEESAPIPTIVEPEQQVVIEDDVVVKEEVTQATSGTCGDNLTWTLDDNGLLTISGTGAMDDYSFSSFHNSAPWGGDIKSVVIESGVTSFGNYAFACCFDLNNISIPNSVTHIGAGTFNGNRNLVEINLPNSVTYIGEHAFVSSGLKNIVLPNSVSYIGGQAFGSCGNLTSIVLPNSITSISQSTFFYCSSLTSVTIPDSVTTIEIEAFSYCTALSSIVIPNSVTTIKSHAFRNCSALTDVVLSENLENLGMDVFVGTPYISSYSGDYIILNGNILYKYNGSDTDVSIPDNIKYIGGGAFSSNLTNITIPYGVLAIGEYGFYNCSSLSNIVVPDSVKYIGELGFFNSGLKHITLPNGIKSLSVGLFNQCRQLMECVIPDSVTIIEANVFMECSSLKNITVPNHVTSIGMDAFSLCSSLSSITLPGSLTEITINAFRRSGLTDVYYLGMESQWNQKNLYNFGSNVTMHFLDIPFTDVPEDAWYYNVAKECYETGLINGTSDITFSPMQTMTRAMVVTILWRMDGQPKTEFSGKFKDVSSGQWYATSISWAANNGVVNGYGDGTFKPDGAVTREQVAVMLANYAGYKKVYKPGTKNLDTYPDGSQVSTWAQQGMKWAITEGIISGDGAGYLHPKKSATRAEGAAMLLRMKKWL